MKQLSLFVSILMLLALSTPCDAQQPDFTTKNAVKRYEIDAKRIGVDPNSDDALPRSREFKRIDSSYYVGWFYEGMYKYNHAADYLGFKHAASSLVKALHLLEKDYKKQLKTQTGDLSIFLQNFKYQLDYTMIAYFLVSCYNNLELPEASFHVLQKAKQLNFQREFYLDTYNQLAWLVHRNRFYTNSKYSFLKNDIESNERLAHRYLDSSLRKIKIMSKWNATIFQPGYEVPEKTSVYHYKSMLYSYALNIDSAEYYYKLMRENGLNSHNNYGTLKMICSDFKSAIKEYELESQSINSDKRLQEWAYYSALISIYKGNPESGRMLSHGMIQANGSTPGYGWYNIALARCALYSGNIEDAEKHISKASNFKELHIGTTLGQTHYDFSVQILQYQLIVKKIASIRFEERHWWLHPKSIFNMIKLQIEKWLIEWIIIQQLGQNPERALVIYPLFSTESTVSWDEIVLLLNDFSSNFFIKKMNQFQQEDLRKPIHKYFQLLEAKLKLKQGKEIEAQQIFKKIFSDNTIDTTYEKLLLARVLEGQIKTAEALKNQQEKNNCSNKLFETYPQLIPFTGIRMTFNLKSHNATESDLKVIHSFNIEWLKQPRHGFPTVELSFFKNQSFKTVNCSVWDSQHQQIKNSFTIKYKNEEDLKKLLYAIFNIKTEMEQLTKL